MSDVLSQSEIDALLAAFASDDVVQEDAGSPSINEDAIPCTVLSNKLKFMDKDLQVLEYIHKEYTQIVSSNLLKNSTIKVSLEAIQEIRYEEFMHSLSYPAVLTVFKLHPFEGSFLFETSPNLISEIADINSDGKQKLDVAKFSENDKDCSIKITKEFIVYLEKAWRNVLKVKPEIEYLEIDPAKINLVANTEAIALASFSINIGKIHTYFNICIPYLSMEKYLGTLEIRDMPIVPDVNTTNLEIELNSSFSNTNLNIKVILDTIELSLNELMNIEKGLILNTHKKYKNKVSVLVEEKHCFNAEVGLIDNRKTVKIIDCLEKDV